MGGAQDGGGLVVVVELASSDLEQVADGHETLLRAVVQIAADTPASRVGGFDDTGARAPQGGRLLTTLELGACSRGEDAHGRDVIVPRRHRPCVHHGHVAEMGGVGGAQAHRQVALEAHVDRGLGLGETRRQRLRERDDRMLHDERARLPAGVVLERLVHPVAVVPAADHAHVLSVRVAGLRDEGEPGVERQRDMPDQAAEELVSDHTSRPFGKGGQQIPAARLHAGLVGVGERRHERNAGTGC